MGVLSTQWRKRAEELNSALEPLLNSPGVAPAVVQSVKAAVLPELLLGFADMLDVLEAIAPADEATQQARERMQRNARIRVAAATGNWTEIDKIIQEAADGKPS